MHDTTKPIKKFNVSQPHKLTVASIGKLYDCTDKLSNGFEINLDYNYYAVWFIFAVRSSAWSTIHDVNLSILLPTLVDQTSLLVIYATGGGTAADAA